MKKRIWFALLFFGISTLYAADTVGVKLYDPSADAVAGIAKAVALAKANKKHVLVQAGGNWCVWCLRFNKFTTEDPQLDSILTSDYIVYHLNWSPENRNDAVFKKYGYAQRFGFPVFIILDGSGNRIHTQNSAYLEEGKGYNKNKVKEFFLQWSPKALDPASYITRSKL